MEYETVIGLEVHAELSTESKIFCSCTTKFGGEENTQCCPICTGMPGVLPVLNSKVVEYAVKAGLAMNCTIPSFCKMDRKNYFYPDLPKAYQISQFDLPLCVNGHIDIETENGTRRIGITRIHIEEDAGKLIHDEWGRGTLVDFNRCGVPLIEIVTEPDMRTAEDAKAFIESVRSILQYTGVSDCKMQEGSLRADVNLSIRPAHQEKLGTRTEMKNLNSLKAITRAIQSEVKRQVSLVESGGCVIQETRRWDDEKLASYSMRGKEEAHDYRYFPEPDLAPVELDTEWIDRMRQSIPELPSSRKTRYVQDMGLPEYDAGVITSSRVLADYFEKTVSAGADAKLASNWIMGDIMRELKQRDMEADEIPFSSSHLARLILLIEQGKISGRIAKDVFGVMFEKGKDPDSIVKEEGLEVVNDEGELLDTVRRVIEANPGPVQDYRGGKKKAIGFLVGQIMKETRGKADPRLANRLISEELNK